MGFFCLQSGPEGGGVYVVEAWLDIQKEHGYLELGSLERSDLAGEGGASVQDAEGWAGATLIEVGWTSGAGNCTESHSNELFEGFGYWFEDDYDWEWG